MIELRIVEHELGVKPEIQYRFVLFTSDVVGALHPPNENNMWSTWKTAEYVKAEVK